MDIIIVDDEPVSLTALEQLIEKLPDCRARGFTKASAALEWCKRNEPDLVIVGYIMPELNGIEFTQHFRSLPGKAETPVLMVTATADREVRNSAFEQGVNDFLNKPYDSVELQARVSNMLVLRSKQQKADAPALSRHDAYKAAFDNQRPAAQGDTERLLDLNMTLKRLADDKALLAQVSRVFIRTVPQLLSAITTALAGNDLERAHAEAHSLKGAVAVFEAPDVLNAIIDVEKHALNYDAPSTNAAFTQAERMIERLLKELSPLAPPEASRAA